MLYEILNALCYMDGIDDRANVSLTVRAVYSHSSLTVQCGKSQDCNSPRRGP